MKTLFKIYNIPAFYLIMMIGVFIGATFDLWPGFVLLFAFLVGWAIVHQNGGFWNQEE